MPEYALEMNIIGAGDKELLEISGKNLLALNLEEMKAVKKYFTGIGRNPTDCELETIAQTWSEHCCHKIFRSDINYTEKANGKIREEKINLLGEIRKVTEKLDSDFCVSVFKDNAGIVKFNDEYGIAFKVETHNHPSALEPYGGAGTGIGGVIRDILGAGRGAKPIMNTDVFCFGLPDADYKRLPEGVLHPRRIFRGVVSGVRDYGNRMGIPTANGAIVFDEGYQKNCLVFCGTVGIIPLKNVEKKVMEDDYIVVIGGKTGRDGIHGATFSSIQMDANVSTNVVQIGNPIVEKKMMDVLLTAADEGLYNFVTDCGAGGLSSAVGEMGSETGAEVMLEKVPLKYSELLPWEIWISESQERMVLSVPGKNLKKLLELFASEDVEAAIIGQFKKTGKLEIYYKNEAVCSLDMNFLHGGVPLRNLKAQFAFPGKAEYRKDADAKTTDWPARIMKLLTDINITSREAVITQYDHEVQAHTVLKPLAGMEHSGPSDAAVLKPLYGDYRGIAVGCGINPFYGRHDPYMMAGCCIEEALRNIVSAGADPGAAAILDNFCWGDVNDEENLGALARCVKGCRDFALKYKLPFISGKDSLNNFFVEEKTGVETSIPGTLLISAVGIVGDIRKTVSSSFKRGGNLLYICGKTRKEMGGSRYYAVFGIEGGEVSEPVPSKTLPMMRKLHCCIEVGMVKSCHDCSDGGFIIALSEMAAGGGRGAEVFLDRMISDDVSPEALLFSESQGRFIVEIDRTLQGDFEKAMGKNVSMIGSVAEDGEIKVFYGGEKLFSLSAEEAEKAWRSGLQW
ncbi:MAG: phosphoribosylformylglycinamidine synthase subunit PurL [Candidatus Omnitrophica bacterium]|nr:phosphoribosylformylglycinamidine synthase subunit PurL [Candidatus Omnitrophota bacterium]